jgi:hypothetical protein
MSGKPGLSRRSALAGLGGALGLAAVAGVAGVSGVANASEAMTGVTDLDPIFGPLHHVGIAIAPNFDDALAKLSAGLGLEFYQPVTQTLTLRLEGGRTHTYTDRFTLTKGGEPHVELLDAVPASFFGADRLHPVCEIGYVVGEDNLTAASAKLTAAGMPRVGTIATEPQPGPVGVAWHRTEFGFLIELLAEDPTIGLT